MNKALILNPPFTLERSLSLKWPLSLRIFWILSILSIVAFLVFYIFQVNREVSEKYSIQKYENRLIELSKENKNLEISSVQAISLNNVLSLLENSDFEKTDEVYYIRILESKVVAK